MLESDGDPDAVTRVLLIEDAPIDCMLIRMAFGRESSWRTSLTVVEDGEKAMEYLKQSQDQGSRLDFVILDLNLSKGDALDVLAWIRRNEGRKKLPVAILSSSATEIIRRRVDTGGFSADGYFTKPLEVDLFLGLIENLHTCFLNALATNS